MKNNIINHAFHIYIEGLDLLEEGRLLNKRNNKYFIEAKERFKEASELGLDEASKSLGLMYIFGNEISQNFEIGFEYLSKAANNQNPESLFWIGYLNFNGIKGFLKPNKERAKYYLNKDQVFNRFKNSFEYKDMLLSLEDWLTESDELGNFLQAQYTT